MQNPLQTNGAGALGNLQFINETDHIMSETLVGGQASFLTIKPESQAQGQKRRAMEAGLDLDDSDSDAEPVHHMQLQQQDGPPSIDGPKPGKKTKGRVKIKMEFIENKLRRYTTFSKRKTGIMKKAYELSTLTGTQVMLLVASETGHVYTFATRKLQPMITSESGKALIQTCLNSPDQPPPGSHNDQRMNPLGFEETELNYAISEEEAAMQKQQAAASMQYIGSTMAPSSPESSSPGLQLSSTPQPIPSPPQLTPAPSSSLPNRTIAMTTYLSPQATVSTGSNPSTASSSNVSLQLPGGGGIATAILPPAGLPPGTLTLSPVPGQLGGQQTIYRLPANMGGGQVLTLPGVSAAATSTITSTTKSDSFQHLLPAVTAQQQLQAATSTTQATQAPTFTLVNSSTAGSGGTAGTLMYQTPQGLMYATPSSALSGLPEGYILNLPQTPGLPSEQQSANSGAQFISIPMQQVLQPIMASSTSEDQQRAAQSRVRK